ncbi:MAG: corrinoid protein [Tannerella sp.]|jgi:corrinoid protein of di/trimethylamine methyltransferase|nr:corrinoid protein [Tannerella sp.]
MENLDLLKDAIIKGNLAAAVEATHQAVAEGCDPQIMINDYMSGAMEIIGQRFEEGQAFVPELLMAARAMKGALEIIKPLLKDDQSKRLSTVVIGTVRGDLHDIGKNLVASMLEGCGFEVVNLGTDVSSDQFIAAVKEHNAHIVCLSALLTTTMTYMKEVIDALEKAGLRNHVKVMIGGAPINESFARGIGADGYGSNANSAVTLAKKLMAMSA